MIFQVCVFFFLHLLRHVGTSDSKHVAQTPAFIVKRRGESVVSEIHCSHNITNYDRILWYKQDEHKAPKYLGYLNMKLAIIEDDVRGKVSFNGDGTSHSDLSVSQLWLNDSGVYYCAARQHSATKSQ
ncbi:T-cell receptor beta chain [Solea senegalensis]|uniref:T cell receptor alpha variable 36/delta variable 7 n=1 Tax=Solea senegalensis TaxID=28829 RepID=UPI001C4250B3|nr:T cell receptor alpha variable 36/delta variable 7 [Solea senegalensis]KAG7511010.1 T-cell receptor beta chain [Solea senegalensis]